MELKLSQDTLALISDQSAKLGIKPEQFIELAVGIAALSSEEHLTIFNDRLKVVKISTLIRDMKKTGKVEFSDDDNNYEW